MKKTLFKNLISVFIALSVVLSSGISLMGGISGLSVTSRAASAETGSTYSGVVQLIADAVDAVKPSVDIRLYNITASQLMTIFTKLIYTQPSFFYLKNYLYGCGVSSDKVLTIYFTYDYTAAQIAQMKQLYEQAVAKTLACVSAEMTDAEKVMAVHDYIILNTKYDYCNYLQGTVPHVSYTAYGVLVNGAGICNAYSLAFSAIMQRLGIETITVYGKSIGHSWNMVKLDGKWYHVDLTWDDPVFSAAKGWINNDYDLEGYVGHDNLLLSDSAARATGHSGWLPDTYPATSALYDNKYASIHSGMFYKQGYWHYIKDGKLTKSLFNLSGARVLKSVNPGSYLGVYGNNIYYNYTTSNEVISQIRQTDFCGTTDIALMTINNTGKTVSEKVTEFVIRGDKLCYTLYRWPATGTASYSAGSFSVTAPIVIAGVVNNACYKTDVTITFNRGTAKLNGNPFLSGSKVSAESRHVLTVTDPGCSTVTATFTIDKTAPAVPALSASAANTLTGSVTVSIQYPADAAVKEYKIGSGSWTAFNAPVVLYANNTVYARCRDAAGNISPAGSVVVSNIKVVPPGIPGSARAVSASYNSIKITWAPVSGAKGYIVYRYNSATNKYDGICVTSSCSYADTGRVTGATYKYKVRAYLNTGGTNVYGALTAAFSGKAIPASPSGVRAAATGAASVKITWNAVSGASGYVIYRYNFATSSFERIGVTTSLSYINKGLSSATCYYYCVRAYRTTGGSNIYSNPSNYVSVKTA
ncbi:MAG: Exoglucanase B precursor [Firmicutes bacterium ADurb.Bin262]|nr:MAG: Exoglucanase B precursor [Firmicutes bacterium ADurb.Bin262]